MDWTSTAPAKLNLSLNITGLRPDGYHNLISLAAFTEYADQLTVSDNRPSGLTISGPFASALQNDKADNLIIKTRQAVLDAGFNLPDHHIYLEKYIPISSGLGGGSSDVAAYLRCIAKMMVLPPADKTRLFSLAGGIGADVPVCLHPGYQIMKGTGTHISPATLSEEVLFCVLTNPGIQISTATIFGAFQKNDLKHDVPPLPENTSLQLKDVLARGNDLYKPAIRVCPQIARLLDQMNKSSVANQLSGTGMSGSGASCFALSPSQSTANQLCKELNACGYWAVATRLIH